MESNTPSPKKSNLFLLTLFILSGFVGIFAILFGFYLSYQRHVLSFSGNLNTSTLLNNNEYFNPSSIKFSRINLSLPVKSSKIENGIWEISDDSASFLNSSAKPGQGGNIVIYGHNKRKIFGPIIGSVRKGDEIELSAENGKVNRYSVSQVFEVKPENIEVVSPTDYEVLTVYTCTGLLDSKRLIIKAYPVQPL